MLSVEHLSRMDLKEGSIFNYELNFSIRLKGQTVPCFEHLWLSCIEALCMSLVA